jgi:cell division septation protein DedD/cbb3-type cytochrome oxidase subunit 3
VSYHLGPIDPDRRAELFADAREGEPPRRPRRVLATVLALLIMGLFSGGLWFAYVQGKRHAGDDAGSGGVPLIRADERPTKVKPERPGGMEIPDRDKLIYNPTHPVVEHLLPPPEKPMARPAPPTPSQAEAARTPTAPPPAASGTPENPPAATQMSQPQQQAAAPPSKPAPAPPRPSKSAAAQAAGTRLQLGSLRSEDAARQEWERIKRKNSDLLGSLSATPVRADLGDKGVYYRIQTGPVADPAAAERICGELKQRSIGCVVAR